MRIAVVLKWHRHKARNEGKIASIDGLLEMSMQPPGSHTVTLDEKGLHMRTKMAKFNPVNLHKNTGSCFHTCKCNLIFNVLLISTMTTEVITSKQVPAKICPLKSMLQHLIRKYKLDTMYSPTLHRNWAFELQGARNS